MSGYSRSGRRSKATRPKAISSSDRTEAKTGRVTEISDRIIGRGSIRRVVSFFEQFGQRRRTVIDGSDLDRLSGFRPHGAVGDDPLALAQALGDLHLTGAARADLDLTAFGLVGIAVGCSDQHELVAAERHQRRLGNHQSLARVFAQGDLQPPRQTVAQKSRVIVLIIVLFLLFGAVLAVLGGWGKKKNFERNAKKRFSYCNTPFAH